MWSPTHVQVLVKRAKGLNIKGKNGTNDAFVTISLGKEKYQTTVKEKSSDPVEWSEQCELAIPLHGNVADINLTVLHRNFLGVDEFLGQISLPLKDFDVYERPKSKWLPLKCKPGKNKNEYRGEIEVKVGFTVKATSSLGGSVAELSKKNKGSLSSLHKISGSISGSLISLGRKEKKSGKKSASQAKETATEKAKLSSGKTPLQKKLSVLPETIHGANEDPGVNSEDEDFDAEIEIEDVQCQDTASLEEPDRILESSENDRSTQRLPPQTTGDDSSKGKTSTNQIVNREENKNSKRVHKNSMEEWEERLKGKQPGKQSVVDRIIEKNELRNKTSSRDSPQSPVRTSNFSPGAHSARLHKNSPYFTRLRRLEQSRQKRPKSLDLSDGRAETSEKFHYHSKQNIVLTEDEFSDLDNEVENITRDIGRSNFHGTKKKESSQIGSQSSLPSYNEATSGVFTQTKNEGKKKKIIPVQSDFDSSSPSPPPSSPSVSPVPPTQSKTSMRMSQSSVNLARMQDPETNRTKKTLGKKLKNSYSFRDHTELVGRSNTKSSKPNQTSPPILPRTSLPHDVLAQYNGKTREDLIEMVINLQKSVDMQGKKVIDLEDYIDNLLIKVLDVAPILLKQDSPLITKHAYG